MNSKEKLILKKTNKMNKRQITLLYKELNVPENIIAHMKQVHFVCEKLIKAFTKKHIKIEKKNILSAALLHDIFRTANDHHAQKAADFLRKKGEKSVAKLVEKHNFFSIDDLKTWEEKILYYADKRVDRDRIVPLNRRFDKYENRDLETEEKVQILENEFIVHLGKLPVL